MQVVYRILWIFFSYSFMGWVFETIISAAKNRKFANKGFYNGPWCTVYGFAAVAITIGFRELTDSWIFLFIGCAVVSTILEWFTGKLLEHTNNSRWWDYSDKKWNLDGYICLQYSVFWGILGAVGLDFINPSLLKIYEMIPKDCMIVIIWAITIIVIIDAIGSYLVVVGIQDKFARVKEINHALTRVSIKVGNWIFDKINNRITVAYPTVSGGKHERVKPTVFAQGCTFYKLVILFFIGAFVGDIVETIFCRFSMGFWMSRSSVVWGPFSIVWGLAIALATSFLYNKREKSDGYLFLFGTVLGGVYEYLCSVFTEVVFGKIFWDYSDIPFNLGGRINLLFCFFWGIAAVLWLKKVYPYISRLIEKIPICVGKITTWIMIVFMAVNIVMSGIAMDRYSARDAGIKPANALEKWIDHHFDDVAMERIYPNAKTTN